MNNKTIPRQFEVLFQKFIELHVEFDVTSREMKLAVESLGLSERSIFRGLVANTFLVTMTCLGASVDCIPAKDLSRFHIAAMRPRISKSTDTILPVIASFYLKNVFVRSAFGILWFIGHFGQFFVVLKNCTKLDMVRFGFRFNVALACWKRGLPESKACCHHVHFKFANTTCGFLHSCYACFFFLFGKK